MADFGERRVAALLAEGRSVPEIAAVTGYTAGYVRMVLKRIYKRQGVSGQVALVPRVLAIDALALPETFFTVWTNVFDRARLAEGESILVHGGSSGIGPRVERSNVLSIMLKRLTVTGSTLRPRSVEQKAATARALHAQVWPLLAAGTVRPIVHAGFPLADAAGAHRLMASSEHVGKIVLEVCRS